MVGRNDPCPCGSGKKYKKCCVNKNLTGIGLWKERALTISSEERLVNTFFTVFDHSVKKSWRGACHGLSSILYILLKEQDVNCQLHLGFVKADAVPFSFCHSWITIDGEVFDIGLYRSNPPVVSPNMYVEVSPPIFKGINLETNEPTPIDFDVTTERVDRIYEQLSRMTLGDYMKGWPDHKDGFWGEIVEIAKKLNIHMNIQELQMKYGSLPYKN